MTYPEQPPSGGDGTDSSRRRRATLIGAGGFLLVVVLCLAIVLFSGGPTPGPQPNAAPPPARGGSVPPDGSDQAIPTSAPPGVTWTIYHAIALPGSPVYGPTKTDGDLATGYAHSPTGALLAATNIVTRYALGADWRTVLARQTVPGPGRQAWEVARASYDGNADRAVPGSRGQYSAFRFINYTPDVATIELVTQFASYGGAQQSSALTVQWNGQDWLLALQPNGSPAPPQQRITSLEGFTPWGPT